MTSLFFLYFFGILAPLLSQTGQNTLPVGKWREGSCDAVVKVENTLFYTNGSYLEMVVLDDDNFPQMVSFFESRGRIYDLTVNGNYVYLAIEKIGMSIVSIEDFANPAETGFCEFKQYYPQVVHYGQFLYCFAGSGQQLKIIDVSDPYNPFILHSRTTPSIDNVMVQGQYLYAACKNEGLRIYDISDPGSLVEVFAKDGAYYSDVDIMGNMGCAIADDTLKILDFTDPVNPVDISNSKTFSYPVEAKISGNFIFTANYQLQCYEISNTAFPILMDEINLPSNFRSMQVSGQMIFIACENGLYIYKADIDGNLTQMNHFQTPGLSNSMDILGRYAYVCNTAHGITILDIFDPENPAPVKFIEIPDEIMSVKVMDQYLYVSNQGLSVYDLTEPTDPQLITQLKMNQQTYKMYIVGNTMYMAAGSLGLAIIDITDPIQPALLSTLDTPGSAFDMDVHNNDHKIYLADSYGGMRIIDISDPTTPVELGSITTSNFMPIVSVKVNDHFAWIGSTNFGIRIFDITDLSNPVYIDDLNTSRGYNISIRNQFAYVSAGYGGLYIYDISQFDNPEYIARYLPPGDVRQTIFSGNLIYCADYYCGVTVFEFDPCLLLDINSNSKNNKCFGYCEGSIEITNVDHAFLPLQYNWSDELSGSSASSLCSGTYSITVTDSNNCMITENFTISAPPILEFAIIQKTDISASSFGAISVQINGGTPPYKYQWKGPDGFVATSSQIDGLSAGCYILTVIDANDCSLVSEAICIIDLTSTKELSADKNGVIIYPNPANKTLYLKVLAHDMENDRIEKIEIFSTDGQMIKKVENYDVGSIDIQELSEGSYFLRMIMEGGNIYSKFIIAR